jgi:hypothetical protein
MANGINDIVKSLGGKAVTGEALWTKPADQSMIIDYTTAMGGCSNLYWGIAFQLPKINYKLAKVDEYMKVSPVHAEAYNLTVAQKQKIEATIKTGMSSVAQAVADYELIAHDHRRYREIFDYFIEGKKNEHVLRSLFVDRVDAYTGEGYSLVTMARRWPTIITDFIRISSEIKTKDDIRHKLDVTDAEASVLFTKNRLYQEWKKLFKPVVEQRLARLETLMNARKKSISEYKDWLRPYIARFQMMKESESSNDRINPYMIPGFGQAIANTGMRLWAWRPFVSDDMQKAEVVAEEKGGYYLDKDRKKQEKAPFAIDPYDDFVKRNLHYIEEAHKVKFEPYEIEELKKQFVAEEKMFTHELYYVLFDIKLDRSVIRTAPPEGSEVEDLMFWPVDTYVISQNVLFLYMIELEAIKREFDQYVDEIIGAGEEKVEKRLREEYEGKEPEKKAPALKTFVNAVGSAGGKATSVFKPFSKYFFKQGPYETNWKERITKIYLVGSGAHYYGPLVNMIKDKMGVN